MFPVTETVEGLAGCIAFSRALIASVLLPRSTVGCWMSVFPISLWASWALDHLFTSYTLSVWYRAGTQEMRIALGLVAFHAFIAVFFFNFSGSQLPRLQLFTQLISSAQQTQCNCCCPDDNAPVSFITARGSICSGQVVPIHYFCGTSGIFSLRQYCQVLLCSIRKGGNSEDKLLFQLALKESLKSWQWNAVRPFTYRPLPGHKAVFHFVLGLKLRAARQYQSSSFYRSENWGLRWMTHSKPTVSCDWAEVRPECLCTASCGMSCWVTLQGLSRWSQPTGTIAIWNGLVSLLPGGWRMD